MEPKLELVKNWLTLALRDLEGAVRLTEQKENPFWDLGIYHCQQAAEKVLKGYLLFYEHDLIRTHDIGKLLSMASEHSADLETLFSDGRILAPLATKFRYPSAEGEPDQDEYKQAYQSAKKIYDLILSKISKSIPSMK